MALTFSLLYIDEADDVNRIISPSLNTCRLCSASLAEAHIPTLDQNNLPHGLFINSRFGLFDDNLLYISRQHLFLPTASDFKIILDFLTISHNFIAFCNMLSKSSIPDHWHMHLTHTSHFDKNFINYWEQKSKRVGEGRLKKVTTKLGIFYIRNYKNETNNKKAQIINEIYQNLVTQNEKFIFAITGDYLLLSNVTYDITKINIPATALYGIIYTKNAKKYAHMQKITIQNILQTSTKPFKLKNTMHQNLLTQITQTLKNTDTLLAKNWYSMMKLDLAKIKIVNVYKLAKNVFIKYPWE